MGRRIEIELTSTREDGSWTWRAAGARQPKGELAGTLLYEGAKVGDVFKVEADFHVDGIEITEVFPPKQKKERNDLLELKTRQWRDDELVTTQRVSRDERRGGRGRKGDDRRRRDDNRGERRNRPEPEARPKPKRLRARRTHRDALLAEVGEEHRPIIEQVIKDGMPGVRAAIERQNSEAKEAGKPEIDAAPILAIAEKNLAKARLAEWRDRADAALEGAGELDLRDLRSVVVAGNDVARDAESRELADKVKTALDERVEADHTAWLTDLESAIGDGRVVRALRLSSRPVKAGAPLPPDLASTLAGQASQALAADVGQERWATVLDALAFSPVRGAVTPSGLPSEPKPDLIDAIKRLSDRLPSIAAAFGIDPATVPKSAKRRRNPRREGGRGRDGQRAPGSKQKNPKGQKADRPVPGAEPKPDPTEAATAEATPADVAAPENSAPEATAPESSAPDVAVTETENTTVPETENTAAASAPDAATAAPEAPPAEAPAASEAEPTPAAAEEQAS